MTKGRDIATKADHVMTLVPDIPQTTKSSSHGPSWLCRHGQCHFHLVKRIMIITVKDESLVLKRYLSEEGTCPI